MDQYEAARRGDFERVQRLVTYKNKDDTGEYDRTVLHCACMGGHDCIVKWLLQINVNVTARDAIGKTPLHLAAEYSHYRCIQLLVPAGADASVTEHSKCIPLHYTWDSAECTALLINAYPAGVNVVDWAGRAPLHKAAEYGTADVCSLLLDAGSIVDAVNKDGRTPLYLALYFGKRNVAELLLDCGAQLELVKLDINWKARPEWALEFVSLRNACKQISKVVTLLRIPGMDPQLFKMLGKYVWNTRKNNNWKK